VNHERVIIVGAGLSGLSVGARLLRAGRDVLILEGGGRPGGQIHTVREAGLTVELGAEGFIAKSRAVPALCELLGIEGALVDQLTTDTYAFENDELVLLPPGEAARRLGFQVPEEELGRGIRSLALGMGQLIEALLAAVDRNLLLDKPVHSIHRNGAELVVERADGKRERATAIVLATPARVAASLLDTSSSAELGGLKAAPLLSNVSVNLRYRREDIERYPAGSGVIFPEALASQGLRALSMVDHKFPGRAPDGTALVRVFFRPRGDALSSWSDERFAATAAGAIQRVLAPRAEPERSWVSRWADALPVFTPEYRALAAAADAAWQKLGVHVTGSAFHGAGIDAAVASAERVAARLTA